MNASNSVLKSITPELPGNKIFKRSFLLILGKVTRLIVQVFIIIWYSRKLSFTDYGTYQSIWLYVNIVSIFSMFGLPSLILSTSSKNIIIWIRQNKVLFFFWSSLLNFIPLIYILFKVDEYSFAIRILVIMLIIVQNISIITETVAIKKEKEKLILVTNIIFSAGYFIWHLMVLYRGYSLPLLLLGLVFMFIIKSLLMLYYGNKDTVLPTPANTVQMGRQWLYLGVNDVLGVLATWLDKWVILVFLSVSQFAVYFNGAYEIPIFGLMVSAVGNIMIVEFSKKEGNDTKKIKSLFEDSSLLLAAVVFPSFCFLFFYHVEFFTLIFGAKYLASIPVFVISIFILPVRIIYSTTVLQVYHRSDLIVKGALLDLLTAIVLMFILYPILQMRGLVLAFVLSTYVQVGYYLWHTGKLINKKVSYFFPFKRLAAIMLLSVVFTGFGYYLFSNFRNPVSMILGIVLCIILIASFLQNYYKKRLNIISGG